MRIPEVTIDEIRRTADLVEFIGRNVALKKRGKNYLGLCPFHKEKTPSFNVSADKGLYYCFGCKKSGDIFTFAMETQKLSYPEAIEYLAERLGIKINYEQSSKQNNSEFDNLYSINLVVAKIFSRNLLKTDEGRNSIKYLNERDVDQKSILNFDIGYALKDWDGLLKEAIEVEGISTDDLLKLGLIKKKDDGNFYDTFRGRIIIPIKNQLGKIIAFGARKVFEDDPLGKYINSPETVIYKKSRVLFGLDTAKESIRENENVIVVEGYLDLISLYQNGIKNVVATSGTAFTQEQAKLISRFTKNIIFVYDSDFAGSNAMIRGIDIILSEGLDVKIALLPEGEDPDSFIRKFGSDKFKEIINYSINFIEFKTQQLFASGKLDSVEDKTLSVRNIVETISKIPDGLKRALFVKDLSEKFNLYESVLLSELEKVFKKNQTQVNHFQRENFSGTTSTSKIDNNKLNIPIEEKDLLISIFKEPGEIIPFIFQNVSLEEIQNPQIRIIIEEVLRMFEENQKIDERILNERVTDSDAKKIMAESIFTKYELSSRWDEIGARASESRWFEVALGAIKKIKKRFLENELYSNREEMTLADEQNYDLKQFLERQHEILKQLKEIENIKLSRDVAE